jgi:hypothetical protein
MADQQCHPRSSNVCSGANKPRGRSFKDLQVEASSLPPRFLGVDAPTESFSIAKRACAVLAAGAVVGTWHEGLNVNSSPFAASDCGMDVILVRLREPLYEESPKDIPKPSDFAWEQDQVDQAAELIATDVTTGLSLGTEQVKLFNRQKKD